VSTWQTVDFPRYRRLGCAACKTVFDPDLEQANINVVVRRGPEPFVNYGWA
jgi:hypothetical protein